jgi:hypothetical protein
MKLFKTLSMSLIGIGFLAAQPAFADSIDPTSYSASLAVGESVTITKTVTVDDAPPTTGVLDVMFLIDTSGSMGGEITAAKSVASDILSGLASFGDLASGVGYYSEPGSVGVYHDLTTDTATGIADINSITLGMGGYGGDFPEEGINAVYEAATGASWRPGSSRFIIALGDATFKESDGTTLAMAQAALADSGATFIGLDFGSMDYDFSGINPTVLADATGGSIIDATSTDPDSITDGIIAGVTAAFSTYAEVSVDDLGAGLPGVDVSVECVTADGAACSGESATGSWTRESSRDFVFDVTFTALEEGVHSFDTHGLVDGGIVASEDDVITVGASSVPEPSALFLMGAGLIGLLVSRKKA